VLVYLHGGANTEGSGSVDAYNGEGLARKGVVVVTVNYRLGIFGFFTHPELSKESGHGSGNYALLDQMAALRWVKSNIAAFGGDPSRVTVAGQSAGAFDIACLIASPLAKGLFQRAIMESGGVTGGGGVRPLAVAEQDGVKFAAAKGAKSLADLRSLPWKDVFAPVPNLPRFGPVTDGYVVAGSAQEIFGAGKKNDVPTLTGSNADENGASPANNDRARAGANDAARDRARLALTQWAAARAENSKSPAYLYFWNHVLPGPDSEKYGAFHTSEVPYVFNSLEGSGRPFTAEDRRIADEVSLYWANFAASGDPNGGDPKGKKPAHWPSFGEQSDMVMELGDNSKPIRAVQATVH
jgi:para-nitrobenzyl esterase